MNRRQFAFQAVLVVVFLAAIHLAVSASAALYASRAYPRRIFDAALFPGNSAFAPLISSYIASNVSGNDVAALGSSFTFGYPYRHEDTYTAELNRRGIQTVNIGVTALSLSGVHSLQLCAFRARKIRPRAVIVEIPLVNEMAWLPKHDVPPRLSKCPPTGTESLTAVFARHPLGVGLTRFLFDRYALAASPEVPSIAKVPDDYFATVADLRHAEMALHDNIRTVYGLASEVSDLALLFVSPVYLDGLVQAGADREAVAEQASKVQEFCREIAGERCLDLSVLSRDSRNFANLTHFSHHGAKALADVIARALRAEGSPRAAIN